MKKKILSTTKEVPENTELALEILEYGQSNLLINLRFLSTAVSRLQFCYQPEIECLHTDGQFIYYNPETIFKIFKENNKRIARTHLHMLLHCIFYHHLPADDRDPDLWNLAADIAVENVINEQNADRYFEVKQKSAQENAITELKKSVSILTAEKIYYYFTHANLPKKQIEKLQSIFAMDMHDYWYLPPEQRPYPLCSSQNQQNQQDQQNQQNSDQQSTITVQINLIDPNAKPGPSSGSNSGQSLSIQADFTINARMSPEEQKKSWGKAANDMKIHMDMFMNQQGTISGSLSQSIGNLNREKYNYTEFLSKFAVCTEVLKTNEDEFDYIYYTLGMDNYKNIPMIEPLEYKEDKRVVEFVIALDTSGSVMGSQVQNFVQKTWNILSSTESFSKKVNVHIIQCDSEIQEDKKITCQAEMDEYLKNMTIRGLGGTDFRPVFRYVDQLIAQHEFKNLKGMVYFTDGYGTFPERMPDYKTAFLFVQDGYEPPKIPDWAIQLIIPTEELDEQIRL